MDISQHAEICSDAINMLRVENIEATLIHLEKLNQFVIQIKNIPSLGLKNDKVLQKLCNRLAVDLSTLRNILPTIVWNSLLWEVISHFFIPSEVASSNLSISSLYLLFFMFFVL